MESFDYLVIGGGSGGLASARRAAAHGAKVALIEAGRLGGTCVNVGCVPKKVMWNAAHIAEHMKHAPSYGFDLGGEISFNWAKLKTARDAYIERLNGIYQRNLNLSEVTVIRGWAKFTDPHTVEVDGVSYRGEKILIATGGRPLVPDIPGAELGITSDGFFELEEMPQKVAIVGAGYIATEIAGVFHALGAEVCMLLRGETLLRRFDAVVRETLMEEMTKDGVDIITNVPIVSLNENNGKIDVIGKGGEELHGFDCLLWAIGREPAVTGMGLDVAGVELGDNGKIKVDELEQTNVPHIYAIGDVASDIELTPVAIAAGRRLSDRLFEMETRPFDYADVPTVVFSHPPIGTVGLTEDQAREEYGDSVHCYMARFTNMFYSISEHKSATAMHVVTVGDNKKVVGIHAIGLGVDEMIQGFAVALRMGATLKDLNRTVAIHPTSSEELVLIG